MDEKIQVYHYVSKLVCGGIETLVVNIFKNINRNKINFNFILISEKRYFYDDLVDELGGRKCIIQHESNIFKPIRLVQRWINLYRFVRVENAEIIHFHAPSPIMAIEACFAKLAGAKIIIIHSHSSQPISYPKTKLIIAIFCRHFLVPYVANYYFACSELAAKWMFPEQTIKKNGVHVIKNAIDIKKFIFSQSLREKVRRENHFSDKFIIGHIGRFVYQKNHDFLIDIFVELHKQNPNTVLLLFGEGDLQETIKQKTINLGLSNAIHFWGVTDRVDEFYQVMDVFVLPSRFEGLGIVAIEAQAAGLKTICADTIPEEARITENFISLSLDQSPKEWADEILKYQDGYERKDMSDAIKNAGYDIAEETKKLENFYIDQYNDLHKRKYL